MILKNWDHHQRFQESPERMQDASAFAHWLESEERTMSILFTRLRSKRVVLCLVMVYVRLLVRSIPHRTVTITGILHILTKLEI